MSTLGNNILKTNLLNTSDLNASKSLHPSIQELQSHLLNLWTSCSVDETYQNLFLVFIESFSNPKEQAREIETEIKKTYEKNSLFFLLQQNLLLRAQIKSQIEDQITKQTQNGSIKKANKVDVILRQLCDKLKNLRRINLLISQNILKIFEDFKITRQNSIGSLGRNYIDIFMKIDVENEFIKESFLNEYILFQKGYDPFFLIHYEETKKSQNLYNLKKHPPVSELFQMNISYVYRLMRAQQKMLKYMLFIDDHAETQKQRKELINRQRLLRIANSNNRSLPEEKDQELHLPPIKSKSGDRNRLQQNASIASTIKQFMPVLQRKPKIMRDKDQVNHSDLSQGVRKKIYSLRPIDSEVIHHSLHSNTPKHYSLNKAGQKYGNALNPMKSPQHQGKYPSINSKNYVTQDQMQNNLMSQRQRQQMIASRQQSQNSATNSQKKWNIKKVLKDRMLNLRPVKTQEYNQDVIDEEDEQENQFHRNRIQYQNDYPVYISLKKSKLADSEVEEISRSRYRIKRDKSRQGKKQKDRQRDNKSREKYKKKQKESKKHKRNKERSESSDQDSRRNSKSKRKKDKQKKKRKQTTSQSEEEVRKTSKKKTKKNAKTISSSQTQSENSSPNSDSISESQSRSKSQSYSESKSQSEQSIKHKKKTKQKKQAEKKKNKKKTKKEQSPSEQEPPKKKTSSPTKQKPKQTEKPYKQPQTSKKQPPQKPIAKPSEPKSQTQKQQEAPPSKNPKPQQKQVSEKQPQPPKKSKIEEKPVKEQSPAKVPTKPEKIEPPPKPAKQQKQAQPPKEEPPAKKQLPKKEPPKPQPAQKKEESPKKEEPPKKVEPPKKEEIPKKVEPSKTEPPKKVQPPKKEEPPKKVEPPKQPPPKKQQTQSQSESQQQSQEEQTPQAKPKAANPSQITATSKIKMIPGKISFAQFQSYIKSKKPHQTYLQKVQQSIKFVFTSAKNTQTYLNEFHLNDQLATIALCSPTASGNMVIYLWMPIDKACDEKSSQFFFKKYLDYLEQQSTYKAIIFSGPDIPELKGEGFVMQKQKNYLRKRVKPVTRESFQLEYFFSMEASNICFIQNTAESLFFSDQISPLSEQNSWCNPDLLNAKEQDIDQELDDVWEVEQKIKSLKQANALLQKDQYDTFEIGQQKIIFKDINMTRSKLSRVPKLGFICNDGFMIVAGKSIIFTDAKRKVDKFQMMNDVCLYFGSGFKNVQQMASFLIKIKDKAKQQDCKIAFKMFSKQVYGRYVVKDPQLQKDKAFYCNWDLNFAWRDEIPGKIVHDMTGVKNKYGPESFVCAVEVKGILTLGIEVEKEDFLY